MNENLFDLRGQVALVTGGNSGIGLGLATGLARAGSALCIWGTNAGKNAAALTAYALRRTHRGTAIGTKFAGIQSLLADMRAGVLAARALLYETARLHDDGADIGARAKFYEVAQG